MNDSVYLYSPNGDLLCTTITMCMLPRINVTRNPPTLFELCAIELCENDMDIINGLGLSLRDDVLEVYRKYQKYQKQKCEEAIWTREFGYK